MDKRKVIQSIFYVLLISLLMIGAYFIILNATWLVGDDSACISHTSWGKFFTLSDYTIPETGRFYPLAFIAYNILPLLGFTSVNAHFNFLAIAMSIMVGLMVYVCKLSIGTKSLTVYSYITLFLIAMIGMVRPYQYFLTTEYSLYIDYISIILWTLCTYYVHEKQSIIASVCGFVVITYFCYCLEVNPIIPCCYGIIGLFNWKNSTQLEKYYFLSMIITTIIYFTLYLFFVYLNIGDNIYDSSHGADISIWAVALRMLYAQKFFLIGIIILLIRFFCFIKRRYPFLWWDNLLLTGFAYYSGCVIIHLHHTVYYWTAVLCMLPAIIYYLDKWIGSKWLMVAILFLSVIMCRTFYNKVQSNQEYRLKSVELQEIFKKEIKLGKQIYYFNPEVKDKNNNFYQWRKQKQECLPVYIGNAVNNHKYSLKIISKFEQLPGIYILPYENNELIPNVNDDILNKGNIVFKGGYGNLTLVEIK